MHVRGMASCARGVLTNNIAFTHEFTDNKDLNVTLAQYEFPVVVHTTIESDGYGWSFRLYHLARAHAVES